MAAKDELGRAGEERAARHLADHGYTIVDRNWRAPGGGELDLVAVRGAVLIVVEVKSRRGDGYGHPLEAIDRRKRAQLWRLSMAWVASHAELARGRRLRVDAISVLGPDARTGVLEHLEDAL